jgi:hypothetical protein
MSPAERLVMSEAEQVAIFGLRAAAKSVKLARSG